MFTAAWKQGAHEHINDMLMRDEIDDLDEVKSWRVVPVYAAPQQQRKPLTDEQVIELVAQVQGPPWLTVTQLIRAVEKAHGITGEQK